ncbi:cbs domain multi-pass transmembrane [Cyclospora cayetanensis]|uniref:Cbs domain multi-pass transmembrane n=1 Tax=Cyclospora cayetanensis TaxID=88456 RepID=A0A1D3D448_9EIME|nr:cbs domain multi-pass transmembrane [Cyclospora cayetanensis]
MGKCRRRPQGVLPPPPPPAAQQHQAGLTAEEDSRQNKTHGDSIPLQLLQSAPAKVFGEGLLNSSGEARANLPVAETATTAAADLSKTDDSSRSSDSTSSNRSNPAASTLHADGADAAGNYSANGSSRAWLHPFSELSSESAHTWLLIGCSALLVAFAGISSGLTTGFMAFDELQLLVLQETGTEKEKAQCVVWGSAGGRGERGARKRRF